MNAPNPDPAVRSRFTRRALRVLATSALSSVSATVFSAQAPAPANAEAAAAAKEDAMHLNAFVVTGSVAPRTKMESPVAITTIDRTRMEELNPRNFAEAMKA